jgi:Mn2+/Fe2+ NRAMP family transporter
LIVANLGTTAAELAGIAAGLQIAGVPFFVSVPVAALTVSALVITGSFRRVEQVLLALSAIFVTYIASGLLSHPH